ncbi:hypothetical protein DRO97_07875 [Archaeoglobales archaeon]|nr:MAG: hypothetical protein DRO97_07875 [Archaeoglobales archaeon]
MIPPGEFKKLGEILNKLNDQLKKQTELTNALERSTNVLTSLTFVLVVLTIILGFDVSIRWYEKYGTMIPAIIVVISLSLAIVIVKASKKLNL